MRRDDDFMHVPHFVGGGQITFAEKPIPEPGPGQLLVRVKANALCGSERPQFFEGSAVTPGHEAAGIVAAVGPQTYTNVGTPGVVYLMNFCGSCRSCRQGFTNQCLAKCGDMGFNKDGGYSPYELISETTFFPVSEDLSLAEATLLLDIMGTGGHAIGRARQIHPDIHTLLIAGAGPIGLGVAAMSRLLLGEDVPVVVADFVPYRLALAEQLGALPVQLNERSVEAGLQAYGFGGVDVAVDTSGKSAARQACLKALAHRGVLVCVGHGEGLELEVSPDLIAPERAVLGSEYFRFDELAPNLERLRTHRAYLSQIITHRYPVENIQQGFEKFFAGETGKVVIEQ